MMAGVVRNSSILEVASRVAVVLCWFKMFVPTEYAKSVAIDSEAVTNKAVATKVSISVKPGNRTWRCLEPLMTAVDVAGLGFSVIISKEPGTGSSRSELTSNCTLDSVHDSDEHASGRPPIRRAHHPSSTTGPSMGPGCHRSKVAEWTALSAGWAQFEFAVQSLGEDRRIESGSRKVRSWKPFP